jgi:O-antigen/teichoic acid export membrane protein
MVVIIIYCFIIPLFFTLVVLEYHDADDKWLLVEWFTTFLISVFWLPCIILMFIYWLHFKIKGNANKRRNKKSR